MTATALTFYAPPGDLALGSINEYLRTVDTEQVAGFYAVPSGRGTMVTFPTTIGVPVKLNASSPPDGAWLLPTSLPSEMRLLFSGPIDPGSIEDGTFVWSYDGSTVEVDEADIEIVEDGYEIRLPIPVDSSFSGVVTLIAEAIRDEFGGSVSPFRTGFQVTTGRIPRPKGEAPTLVYALRMARLVASGVSPGALITDFCTRNSIAPEDIVQTEYLPRGTGIVEILTLWRVSSETPVLIASDPPLESTIPENSAPEELVLHFSAPVSGYHLKGEDGVTRLEIDDEPVLNTMLEQVDAAGTTWRLTSLAGLIDQRGVHTLLIRGVPGIEGRPSRLIRMYTWTTAPVVVTSGGSSEVAYCQVFAGNGIQVDFVLTEAPTSCSLSVFVNGAFQHLDCYSVVGSTLTFFTAPFNGAVIEVRYTSSA